MTSFSGVLTPVELQNRHIRIEQGRCTTLPSSGEFHWTDGDAHHPPALSRHLIMGRLPACRTTSYFLQRTQLFSTIAHTSHLSPLCSSNSSGFRLNVTSSQRSSLIPVSDLRWVSPFASLTAASVLLLWSVDLCRYFSIFASNA